MIGLGKKNISRGKKMKRTDLMHLAKKRPEKNLIKILKKNSGRNAQGRITVRHRGGGFRKYYRIINFGQEKINIPGRVIAIEYDPNRTAFIALVEYQDKKRGYILCPQGLKDGDEILAAEKAPIKIGNRMKLKNIPVGTEIHNISLQPSGKGKIVRSAGTWATVLAHEGNYSNVLMPSKEVRKIHSECFASIGSLSHPEHRFIRIPKAGISRLKGRRPTVRGSAMNPVDHPHGGGEGRTGIGLKHPKTPWGKIALGVKTRRRKTTDQYIIQRRPKKKRK